MANRSNRHTRVRIRRPDRDPVKPSGDDGSPPPLEEVPGRRKRRTRPWLRVTIRLGIVAVTIAAICLVWFNWDAIAPDGLAYMINSWMSGSDKGDGYPVRITGSAVISMAETSEGLAVLTDTNFLLYNTSGGEAGRWPHGYADPVLKTAGKWMLVYDQAGKALQLRSRGSEWTLATDNPIVSASVNAGGDVAVVTLSSGSHITEARAYTGSKKEPYIWYSADLYLTDAAINGDGDAMAAVGYKGSGQGQSEILLLNLRQSEPIARYSDPETLLYHVAYMAGDRVAAIGDKGLWIVSADGTVQKRTGFDDREIMGFTVAENGVSVVLEHYGGASGGRLLTVDPSGSIRYTFDFEGEHHHIAPAPDGVYLLTSQYLYRAGPDGPGQPQQVTRDGKLVSALRDKAIIAGLTELRETTLKAD